MAWVRLAGMAMKFVNISLDTLAAKFNQNERNWTNFVINLRYQEICKIQGILSEIITGCL